MTNDIHQELPKADEGDGGRLNHLYLATCMANGKQYVGVTNTSTSARWRNHCWHAARGGQLALQRALRKYGSEGFAVETLWSSRSRADVHAAEIALIRALATTVPDGYNITAGGEGTVGYRHTAIARAKVAAARLGTKRSPETNNKIVAAQRGKKRSPETRANIAAALRGKKRGPEVVAAVAASRRRPDVMAKIAAALTGKRHTEKTKALISAANGGRKLTAEHVAEIVAANTGRLKSEEERARISAALTGRKRGPLTDEWRANVSASLKGRTFSAEHRTKISEAKRGKPRSPEVRARLSAAALARAAARKEKVRDPAP